MPHLQLTRKREFRFFQKTDIFDDWVAKIITDLNGILQKIEFYNFFSIKHQIEKNENFHLNLNLE